jgi:uncharacterized protein (DUF488 family)
MQPLFTIGHSKHTIEKFIELLSLHKIAHLVDVRTFPSSRFSPQFNQPALEAALKVAGIQYHYEGKTLGGRGRESYDELRKTSPFRQSLKELEQLSQEAPTAIMCAEENPYQCHRRFLIARSLWQDRDFRQVLHIRQDGGVLEEPGFGEQPTQMSLGW